MEFLGTINTVWAFAFAVLYLTVETIKATVKSKKEKKNEFLDAVKALSEKLDNHIAFDIKKQKELSLQVEGMQILNLINFSPRQENRIDKAFNAYQDKDGNSVVEDAYYEYKQKRQNSLANLKRKKQ